MTMSSFHVPAISSLTDKATSISELRRAHAHLLKTGLINDPFAASRLISFACTNPNLQIISYCHSIFTHLNDPNSFTWNSMIRAYANSSTPQNSLFIFTQMLGSSVAPDKYTYPFVIKACSALNGLNEGQQVHAHVVKRKDMRDDVYVQNTLISMYANCGCFEIAHKLLDKMPQRDVISWNAFLSAYAQKGLMDSASLLFHEMEEKNVESWNFMVSGYAKLGLVEEARRLFDEAPVKDVVSWNAIISGYADVGDFNQVLHLFQDMLRKWIHLYIDKNGISVEDFLATALVDMYSKCGEIAKALKVFGNTSKKDISTWNSMIGGLSINGFGEEAVGMFHKMLEDDYKPNEITFINILSACSHAGYLIDGLKIMNIMIHDYDIQPTVEHYGCVIDLLGRAGLLEEAKELLKGETPGKDSPVLWQSLLSSCINYGNLELAQDVAEKLLELDPQDNAGYVQLSNVYASDGKWESAAKVRRNMKSQGVRKEAGCSMIEIDGVVHEFLAAGVGEREGFAAGFEEGLAAGGRGWGGGLQEGGWGRGGGCRGSWKGRGFHGGGEGEGGCSRGRGGRGIVGGWLGKGWGMRGVVGWLGKGGVGKCGGKGKGGGEAYGQMEEFDGDFAFSSSRL
ncbi:hypothetical protein RDABS01_011799 [Bienertia sinuspersici]